MKVRRQQKRVRSTYVKVSPGKFSARAVDGRTGLEGVATRPELARAAADAQGRIARGRRTSFDDFIDEQTSDPARAKMYEEARAGIDARDRQRRR